MSTASSGGAGGAASKRIVLWFRNDLRLHDNYIVAEAVKRVKAGEYKEVVPVFCFEPRFFAPGPRAWGSDGSPRMGPHRARFTLESVEALRQALRGIGSDLVVLVGKPEEVIAGLAAGSPSPLVLTSEEVTSEEVAADGAVARAIKPLGGQLVKLWNHTLFHLADLTSAPPGGMASFRPGMSDMPDVFTPFKEKVEKRVEVRKEVPAPAAGQLPLPSGPSLSSTLQMLLGAPPVAWSALPWPGGAAPPLPETHKHSTLPFKGGEAEALKRLRYYLWDSDLIATYFDTRNGMLGGDYSTKFAPWLALGCLSPRKVYWEIRKYEAQRTSNKSTYWVIFELIWRDYYRFFGLKHGDRMFYPGGTVGRNTSWSGSAEALQRWREGRTGYPLVDANMRELAATGFMSNRGRQNVASFLALDLGVDWRKGAWHFEALLMDYDVTSNWGNWVAAAGLTGGRINHFNIAKQSKDYDADGKYVKAWCPELANVPASRVHEPWLMSKEEQEMYKCRIGVDYPAPLSKSRSQSWEGGRGGGGGSRSYGGGGRGGSGAPPRFNDRSGGRGGRGAGGSRRSNFEMYG